MHYFMLTNKPLLQSATKISSKTLKTSYQPKLSEVYVIFVWICTRGIRDGHFDQSTMKSQKLV